MLNTIDKERFAYDHRIRFIHIICENDLEQELISPPKKNSEGFVISSPVLIMISRP